MKYGLMRWLACPACGGTDLRLDTRKTRSSPVWAGQVREDTPGYDAATGQLEEVAEGSIGCGECGRVYPITDGIPHLLVEEQHVPRSAHVTSHFDAKAPEWEQEFRDFVDPLGPDDFVGRLALDVGCGFGRGAYFAARWGAEVVALDVDHDILVACRDNTRDIPRVHHVHADARHLPFPTATFDIVYALGLLHHLDQPWEAFHAMAERVKPGGRLSIWAYGPRQGASAALSALLRGVAKDMPPDELLNVSRLIATMVRGVSHTPYRLFRRIPGMHSLVSHLPMHDHHRWPYDIVVSDIYDRLRIPVTHTFTAEEIESHYVDEGFLDVRTSRRVRNNESFRATGIRR
jgi:SAM-dependent methyltransferase